MEVCSSIVVHQHEHLNSLSKGSRVNYNVTELTSISAVYIKLKCPDTTYRRPKHVTLNIK